MYENPVFRSPSKIDFPVVKGVTLPFPIFCWHKIEGKKKNKQTKVPHAPDSLAHEGVAEL